MLAVGGSTRGEIVESSSNRGAKLIRPVIHCLLLCLLPSLALGFDPPALTVPDTATSADLRQVAPDGQVISRHFESAADVAQGPQHWLGQASADGLYRHEIHFAQALPDALRQAAMPIREQGKSASIEDMP